MRSVSIIAAAVGLSALMTGQTVVVRADTLAGRSVTATKNGGHSVKDGRRFSVKPLPKDKSVRWSHAPYIQGDCSICHLSSNPDDPGDLRVPTNRLCLTCHKPMKGVLENRRFVHKPAAQNCSHCHNPHNSKNRLLLYRPPGELCATCHQRIDRIVKGSKVQHAPALKGNTCRNCHNPHATNVEHLLRGLPSDLCMKCHGKDGLKDDSGKRLVNLASLLKKYDFHHKPIDQKDCSACHGAHGTDHYRLLVASYPRKFYAPYKKEAFALCFSCHNKEQSISQVSTTSMTGFRDGSRNLHSVHIKIPKNGRTCRACHGEHAAPHVHLIGNTVDFGNGEWLLEINYVPTKTGGRCSKTCHRSREYRNK